MRCRGTTLHNHKTWAVVVGIEGQEHEISYDRLDDGAMHDYADLKRSAGAGTHIAKLGSEWGSYVRFWH